MKYKIERKHKTPRIGQFYTAPSIDEPAEVPVEELFMRINDQDGKEAIGNSHVPTVYSVCMSTGKIHCTPISSFDAGKVVPLEQIGEALFKVVG